MPVAKLIDYSSVLRPCTIRKVAHIESSDNLNALWNKRYEMGSSENERTISS